MRFAFLCDFDGTVSPSDIGAALVGRFTTRPAAEGEALLARWAAGEIGHRELTEAECRSLRVAEADAIGFVRGFSIDPAFADFVREAEARGDAVAIASEGFGFYIREQLDRAGLSRVAWTANHARFEDGTILPEFPHAAGGCGACGNCKGTRVAELRAAGYEVVMVGDGLSDRCGARAADRVLARGALLAWCAETGLAASAFDGFGDVARLARAMRAAGPARAAAAANGGA